MNSIFSGIRPSGKLHLGNYLGAIKNWIALQDDQQTEHAIYAVVDLHGITTPYDPATYHVAMMDVILDYLAAGIEPSDKTLLVRQSKLPHAELAWLFNTLTPLGALQRMTQFKEKKERVEVLSAGLLNYPVLQAADIALYKAQVVPVGEDQLQHLELSREIIRRFNTLFGNTFPEPESRVSKETARVMALNDPAKKMSKSVEGSFIALTDSDAEIAKKIKRAVTDVGPQDPDTMSPGVANLFMLLKSFSEAAVVQKFVENYENKTLKYAPLKDQLVTDVTRHLAPLREKILSLESQTQTLQTILADGAERAARVASATMKEVYPKMGLLGPARS